MRIPTDTTYLANKSSMKLVGDTLDTMYTSLRAQNELSHAYTTDILKSIATYKVEEQINVLTTHIDVSRV
jgi:hypothetical protein